MKFYTHSKIMPNVTRIVTRTLEYIYLVEGEEKALLIDTGVGYGNLAEYVKPLTDKPLTVVCTHGHVDHAGGAYGFNDVWLSPKDFELAKEHTQIDTRFGYVLGSRPKADKKDFVPPFDKEWKPLEEEQVFDLGGTKVTALPIYGHTQGSMAMLLEPQRVLILGDACNSSTFLFLPHSTTIAQYKKNLESFKKYEDRYDTVLYSHQHNKGGKEIVDEAIALCDAIIRRKDEKIEKPVFPGIKTLMAKAVNEDGYNKDGTICNILYNPDQII